MRKLIAMTIAVLALSSTTLASGDIFITISGNQGQIKTEAQEFRYVKSPRDLAGQQLPPLPGKAATASVAVAAGPATSARGATGGRAGMRRANNPVVIVHNLDEASPFFVKAAASGETFTSVVFEFRRAVGSGTEVYQTVTLTNVQVSSVKTVNGDGRPMEEVSFTFQKIEYENKDGAAAAPDTWKP